MAYNRITDKELVLNLNINQNQDLTKHFLFVQRLWELENGIEKGEYIYKPFEITDELFLVHLEREIIPLIICEIKLGGCGDGWQVDCVENGIRGRRFLLSFHCDSSSFDEVLNRDSGAVYPKDDVFFTVEEAEQRLKELKTRRE